MARRSQSPQFGQPRQVYQCPPGQSGKTQLHVFADASETGYAAVSYVRRETLTTEGTTDVSARFLMGKCLVCPSCTVTIPRLVILLMRELDTIFDEVFMWTDSMVVLSCIKNQTTRFKTDVSNRVSYIQGSSDVADWRHVPSECNPADIGSRGCHPDRLDKWLHGPSFLKEEQISWPSEPGTLPAVPTDEVKKPIPLAAVVARPISVSATDALIEHYSSFFRLKKAVAWFRRFSEVLRDGSFNRARTAGMKGLRKKNINLFNRLRSHSGRKGGG